MKRYVIKMNNFQRGEIKYINSRSYPAMKDSPIDATLFTTKKKAENELKRLIKLYYNFRKISKLVLLNPVKLEIQIKEL